MRVGLAEKGSIREAQVGELRVAERGTDDVHVIGRARSVHEWKDPGASVQASGHEVLQGLDRGLLFLRVVEDRVEGVECVLFGTGEAFEGRALADAARIE